MNEIHGQAKVPFNSSLFFNAVERMLGEPVKHTDLFDKKSYQDYFWEVPKGRESKKKFFDEIPKIGEWLKLFNIEFPGSRCDVAKWDDSPKPNTLYFRITISYNNKEKE